MREIAGRKVTVFNQAQAEDTSVATIVVRASTENLINDVERALDDGIHAFKTLCADPRLLPGAGAVELELSKRLREFAKEDVGLDQYAIRKFAEAFDVVPRTLAENSGCDPTNIMHTLHGSHSDAGGQDGLMSGESKSTSDAVVTASGVGPNMGFSLETTAPMDAHKAEIYDVYATKVNALRLAVDAAITVLKVDQIVMSKPAGGPRPRKGPNDPDP